METANFLLIVCISCHPNNSVKALNEYFV